MERLGFRPENIKLKQLVMDRADEARIFVTVFLVGFSDLDHVGKL